MKRRDFLRSASAVSAALAFPKMGQLLAPAAADAWRTFEVTTSVQVLKPSGMTRIWLPAALFNPTPFQKTLGNHFNAGDGTAKMVESKADTLGIIAAEFPAGVKPMLSVTSQIKGREDGCRKSPRDLRVDCGEHVPESEDAGLRPGRHSLHAGDQGFGRQVCRPECVVCRARQGGGPSGTRRVRYPGCQIRLGI